MFYQQRAYHQMPIFSFYCRTEMENGSCSSPFPRPWQQEQTEPQLSNRIRQKGKACLCGNVVSILTFTMLLGDM